LNINKLYTDIESFYPKMVDIRRDLHKHPELGFEEVRTPKVIADFLKKICLEVRTEVGGRGVVGILRGKKDGQTIALRADFDALPIHEENDLPYTSTIPGVMHACGHDGHTATLLGVASVLSNYRDELKGNVVFIHQFGEEVPPGGAKPMIEDGCLDGVDVIFGTHLMSTIPLGEIHYNHDYLMAGGDLFEITIKGKGGHGAQPHETIDPIVTASQLVMNFHHVVSRNIDPLHSAVLTVGAIHSGDALNIIPDEAKLGGTIRAFDPNVQALIEQKIRHITESTCTTTGADFEIEYMRGYKAVRNDHDKTEYIKNISADVVGKEQVIETKPVMAGEDFSNYLHEIPGSYFFTGAMMNDPEQVYAHHHPRFNFDEKAMLIAAKIFLTAVAKYQ